MLKVDLADLAAVIGLGVFLAGLYLFDYRWAMIGFGGIVLVWTFWRAR